MWSQALPKWISWSSRDREWVLNGESEDSELEDSESEDGGFADGDCRLSVWPLWLWRPSIVPCRGAVHAFLHGMAFCIACTVETYAYPNARSQSSDGFNWQQARIPYLDSAGSKSGSQTCAQSAMGLDYI